MVTTAIGLWNIAAGIATTVTTALGVAVAFLTSPIGIVILIIGALIAVIVLLAKNWDKVKETAEKVWKWITDTWGKLAQWWDDKITKPLGTSMEYIGTVISDMGKVFSYVWDKMSSIASSVSNSISRFINDIVSAVKKAIEWLDKLINKNKEADKSGSSKPSPKSTPASYTIPRNIAYQTLALPTDIPRLATGAVVKPNKEFLAILGDNKREQEFVTPESAMKQSIKEVIEELGGVGKNITIQLVVSGRVLAETVWNETNDFTEQTGVTPLLI